jgi:hypothetical protein
MSQTTGLHAAANSPRKTIAMSQAPATPPGAANNRLPTDDELREVAASLRGIRFGSVTIVVQDGVIIQIDKTEKRRLRNRRESGENDRS